MAVAATLPHSLRRSRAFLESHANTFYVLFFPCSLCTLIKSRQYLATFPAYIFFDPFRLTNDLTFLLGQLMNAIKRNTKLNS